MYSIYCDDICIHNDRSALSSIKVVNPKLTMADSAAGSLTFTLPPANVGYSAVQRLTSDIKVYRDNEEIWSGRVIDEQEDFWKQRSITCEGELAYLNDTTQPPHEYHDISVSDFLGALISVHNAKAKADKQFKVGIVTVIDPNDSIYRYTNYETTLACINDKLVSRLGGHIRIRKDEGYRYIDYLADYPNMNSQVVQFGTNLLDFTKNWDLTDLATVIVPRGAALDESPIEALQAYLGVEEVNDGSPYVVATEAEETYGWIETVVTWDDVTVASNLLRKAEEYLADAQFEKMVLEVSAVDLHYLSADMEAINLLDEIRCVSNPHGMDRVFPVTKVVIPLDRPEETVYTFGSSERQTLTGTTRGTAKDILEKIDKIPSKHDILEAAKDNASALLNSSTNGYVTILKGENGTTELIISNEADWTKATKIWRWNMNGLGYSDEKDENGDRRYKLAMTMDGSIVADFITTGILNGDLIRAGKIRQATIPEGKTEEDVSYWDLDNGTMNIVAKSFKLSSGDTIESVAKAQADSVLDTAKEYADGLDANLTQLEIFKRLTNNEANQGIYLEGTKLYINAELIRAEQIFLEDIPLSGQKYRFTNGSYKMWDCEKKQWTDMTVGTTHAPSFSGSYEVGWDIDIVQYPYYSIVSGNFDLSAAFDQGYLFNNMFPIAELGFSCYSQVTTYESLSSVKTDLSCYVDIARSQFYVTIEGKQYRRYGAGSIVTDRKLAKSASNTNITNIYNLSTMVYPSLSIPLYKLLEEGYIYEEV